MNVLEKKNLDNQENIKIFDPQYYGQVSGYIFKQFLKLNNNFVCNWNCFIEGFKQESQEQWNNYKKNCVILNKNLSF